jgi:quinohemoprotein ethanol dehydrogenase
MIANRTLRTIAFCLLGLGVSAQTWAGAGAVDSARLAKADKEPENWFTAGRDKDGTYFSPLKQINPSNVDKLGFAWSYDLGTERGQQATPVVVDGVMYTSGNWGWVYAVDAASGKELWRYDPDVPGQAARAACCDIVNRGVAVFKGKVYVASIDGRLHAIDAATGKRLWEVDTIADHLLTYASTGAPQIAKNVVIIGNAGGDMDEGGVRGYVTAYDLETGHQKWRFFTVPPVPGQPFEHPEIALAAKTWDPDRDPKFKGGGTVWDGTAYDTETGLVYFGTGNTAPYDTRRLGPKNGDDLFVASIVAVNPDTGRMAWHYQTTPQDRWDYDAVQKLVLATLTIDGHPRRVVMQANKNGFFYVLDAKTGKLLSAKNFAFVNWAKKIDLKTGRPVLTEQADYFSSPKNIYPSVNGAHSWQAMSYNRETGLMYVSVVDAPNILVDLAKNGGTVKYLNGFFTTGGAFPDDDYNAADWKTIFGPMPELSEVQAGRKVKIARELLRAWDPVRQKIAWEQETSSGIRVYDGGAMSTAGNLVFQGHGNGELAVYAADTGKLLKTIQTGSHLMATATTYAVNGEQYVAIQAGFGGTAMALAPIPAPSAARRYQNVNRIIAFKLGGGAVPVPPVRVDPPFPQPPASQATAEQLTLGEVKFVEQCSRCHQFGPSITPDLRKLTAETHAAFKDIVLHGARAALGMGNFSDLISETDADAIHAYLIDQQAKGFAEQEKR